MNSEQNDQNAEEEMDSKQEMGSGQEVVSKQEMDSGEDADTQGETPENAETLNNAETPEKAEPSTNAEILKNAEAELRKQLGEDLLGVEILNPTRLKTATKESAGAESAQAPEQQEQKQDSAEAQQAQEPEQPNQINLMIRVKREAWIKTGEIVRDSLNCRWLDFLSAIDWMDSPYGRELDAEQDSGGELIPPKPIEWGQLGGETRIQILARVRSVEEPLGIILKADLPDEAPVIDSWVSVYPGVDWHERETWEMFGIVFTGHPGLRHLYLPTEFEGYPLRKDFPLLARRVKPWPGIVNPEDMPGLESEEDASEEEASEEVEAGADS